MTRVILMAPTVAAIRKLFMTELAPFGKTSSN